MTLYLQKYLLEAAVLFHLTQLRNNTTNPTLPKIGASGVPGTLVLYQVTQCAVDIGRDIVLPKRQVIMGRGSDQ